MVEPDRLRTVLWWQTTAELRSHQQIKQVGGTVRQRPNLTSHSVSSNCAQSDNYTTVRFTTVPRSLSGKQREPNDCCCVRCCGHIFTFTPDILGPTTWLSGPPEGWARFCLVWRPHREGVCVCVQSVVAQHLWLRCVPSFQIHWQVNTLRQSTNSKDPGGRGEEDEKNSFLHRTQKQQLQTDPQNKMLYHWEESVTVDQSALRQSESQTNRKLTTTSQRNQVYKKQTRSKKHNKLTSILSYISWVHKEVL